MGDMIDRNVDSFNTILPYFNKNEGPKYNVLGNHDFAVPTDQVVDILGIKINIMTFLNKAGVLSC